MGVNPPSQSHAIAKDLPSVSRETLLPEFEPGINELNVRSFSEGVVDDCLVLVNGYGAGGVNDISSRFGIWIYAIDCAKDELFLEVREEREISVGLRNAL